MTILEIIAEWRRGCSCAVEGKPEQCEACTRAAIDAIESAEKKRIASDGVPVVDGAG
jgi:hypothetical protein